MRAFLTIINTLAVLGLANALGLAPGQITDFVTFGDSYTDTVTRGDGPDAVAWPVFVKRLTNTTLHPFAKSGATCSVNFTGQSRSVFEYQLPDYFKWKGSVSGKQGDVDPLYTVYTLWIGTNDVGRGGLLGGHGQASIVDIVNCSVNWVKTLYDSGARNFIFQNMIPLQLTPVYHGDVFMRELVQSGNFIAQLLLNDLAKTLDCAHIGLFDSYGLFWDMYHQPKLYLNGTVPPDLGVINGCVTNSKGKNVCYNVKGAARNSYLW
ncbi:hypothetical protein ONZ45_g12489 [Pleurotus djamor]|nr:hypothetical protein ONZ45_g12489 [Pleurotus djamor]